MNQEKIGKFIAKKRTNKKLTQEELAKKLNVTDKAISKWENGRGLPDPSLFKPLCQTLDITISELLSGEQDNNKSNEDGYIKYIDYSYKKYKKRIILSIIISLSIIAILISGIFFLNNYGKTTVYKLYGESENFIYSNGLLTTSNDKNILVSGKLAIRNDSIPEKNILSVTIIASDNRRIYLNYVKGNDLAIEDYGYNEIFTKELLNNIANWKLKIEYYIGTEIYEEYITIQNEQLIRTDKFFTKKILPISYEEPDPIIEDEDELSPQDLREKLLADGFVQVTSENDWQEGRERTPFYLVKIEENHKFYINCIGGIIRYQYKIKNHFIYANFFYNDYYLDLRDGYTQNRYTYNSTLNQVTMYDQSKKEKIEITDERKDKIIELYNKLINLQKGIVE